MNGKFIYYKKIDYAKLSGIDKKILNQIDVLNKEHNKCDLIIMENNNINKMNFILKYLKLILPYSNLMPVWSLNKDLLYTDFIYFRRPSALNYQMLKVFKLIKDKNPKVKIIMEIPTYPYNKEYLVKPYLFPLLIKDLYNRGKIKNIVDRIAIQNDISEVFGIKTLNFTNGINVSKIFPKKINTDKDVINICAVASLEPWDGYERVIKGLYNYKKSHQRKIIIHIVGQGSEKKKYEKLVSKLKLTQDILFYGKLSGSDLDKIYDKSELALDVFGMYKKNNDVATSLKSREYLAKGLPIILGCKVDIITDDYKFALRYPNRKDEIDFLRIIDFYDSIYLNNSKIDIINEIRSYAYEVCDISKTMIEIIDYLKSN